MKPRILMIAALVAAVIGIPAGAHAQMPGDARIANPQAAQGVINPPSGPNDSQMAKRPQGADVEFVDEASLAGKNEVQAGQLALERSPSPDIHAFAKRMIVYHGKTNDQPRKLGTMKGVPVQAARIVNLDIEALRSKSGHEFDVAYVAVAGPEAHLKAIRLFEAEARNGRDSDLRVFAGQTLPALREHFAEAQALARKMGVQ